MNATIMRALVERFYAELWNAHALDAMPEVLDEAFVFRGSLGDEKRGHAGFGEYVDAVHAALGEYRCDILDVVCEDLQAFARVQFTGIHRGVFRGFEPTGQEVSWVGCALFRGAGERIGEAWVLGDLYGLDARLAQQAADRR